MPKILCAAPKHFDQLTVSRNPTYNSALRLPRRRWPVMRLRRLYDYGAIMATLLFDATKLESFWCSTMQSYQKLSTKLWSSLVLFVTSYLFESGFPRSSLKKQHLNPLNDLCEALSNCVSRCERIISEKQQKSH